MADHWLDVSSAEYESHCGDEGLGIDNFLDGNARWMHSVEETHYFVLDFAQTYTIKKVKGRGNSMRDPIDVNIYIDDSNPPTTLCEEGITTWKDTIVWQEITLTTEGTGRYIKVEIEHTEHGTDWIDWYAYSGGYLKCFDAYGDVAAPPPPAVLRPTVAVGNPLIF